MKNRQVTMKVAEGFKAIIKAEAALHGKSVANFTESIAKKEKFISEYFSDDKQKGLRRKDGFGFRF